MVAVQSKRIGTKPELLNGDETGFGPFFLFGAGLIPACGEGSGHGSGD